MESPKAPEHRMISTSPCQLTPRSKVRAMLAKLDNDTDSDSDVPKSCGIGQVDPTNSNLKTLAVPSPCSSPVPPKLRRLTAMDSFLSEKPLQALDDTTDLSNKVDKVSEASASRLNGAGPGMTAYERIKKQLAAKAKATSSSMTHDDVDSIENLESRKLDLTGEVTSDLDIHITERTEMEPRTIRARSSNSESEEDLPEDPHNNKRFLELVARQKRERLAREAEAKARNQAETTLQPRHVQPSGYESETDNEAIEQKLTQQTRPARKASKRAIEEMSRETQRLSRNMQLAHQAKTRTKVSKQSLLARFDFGMPKDSRRRDHTSDSEGSHRSIDDHHNLGTPPTSPPSISAGKETTPLMQSMHEKDAGLPDLSHVLSQSLGPGPDKGDQISVAPEELNIDSGSRQCKVSMTPEVRLTLPQKCLKGLNGSDDELEVLAGSRTVAKLDAFTRKPQNEAGEKRPLRNLRFLAHVSISPGKKAKSRNFSSQYELQSSLRQKAREQALEQRKIRIEELKAKGIFIQTEAEREKEQVVVEDLLEKARQEGEALREKEKRQKKKAADEKISANDSEGEEGYNADGDADYSDEESEEEEPESGDEGAQLRSPAKDSVGMIDEAASDDSRAEEDIEAAEVSLGELAGTDSEDDTPAKYISQKSLPRHRRQRQVIDDEEEGGDEVVNAVAAVVATQIEGREESENAMPKIFQPLSQSPALGLTQLFGATLANTQSTDASTQDALDRFMPFDAPPDPNFPLDYSENSVPQGSCPPDSISNMNLNETSSMAIRENPVGLAIETQTQQLSTQMSDMPELSQDVGFMLLSPPPALRESAPPSTIDTVIVQQDIPSTVNAIVVEQDPNDVQREEVPVARRGRLRRGPVHAGDDMERKALMANQTDSTRQDKNAFSAMEGVQKRSERVTFNKKRSNAKEMVEEQAQESEDEYAGLGGASDEDSAEEDAEIESALIDKGSVDVNERELAALYADKQRAADGKAIEKIFKDIATGGFRRKRTTDFDLSDSDDGGEVRRRRKQREFAKMRKALLENEDLGKLAEDPKKMAFMRAIEDRDDDLTAAGLEVDFLDNPAEDSFCLPPGLAPDCQDNEASQTPAHILREGGLAGSNTPVEPPVVAAAMGPPDLPTMSKATNSRRTKSQVPPSAIDNTNKRPASLLDIRQSVSFLVEDPGADISQNDVQFGLVNLSAPSSPASSPSDEEADPLSGDLTMAGSKFNANPRRTRNATTSKFINRIALRREESSNVSNAALNTAFLSLDQADAVPSLSSLVAKRSAIPGYRLPALSRRSTTSSISSASSTASTSRAKGTQLARTEREAGLQAPLNSLSHNVTRSHMLGAGATKRSSVNFLGSAIEKVNTKGPAIARMTLAQQAREKRERRESQKTKPTGSTVLAQLSRLASWG